MNQLPIDFSTIQLLFTTQRVLGEGRPAAYGHVQNLYAKDVGSYNNLLQKLDILLTAESLK